MQDEEEQIGIHLSVLGDGFVCGQGVAPLQGWASQLMIQTVSDLGPVNVYNLGIPGELSTQVVARLRELAPRRLKGEDNRLVFSFGLQDTAEHEGRPMLSNQASTDALKQLIVKTRPHFKLLMIGMPPVYDPQRNSWVKRLNSLQHDLCQKAHVPFIDLFSALADDVQYKRSLLATDRVHPDSRGHQKIFDLIWNDRSWWFNN